MPGMDTLTLILGLSVLIGLLALDTTLLLQVLISHPVFSCPLIGWVLGDPVAGFKIGMMMQLLWLNEFHVGAYRFAESNPGSMITCCIYILAAGIAPEGLVLLAAVLSGLVASYAGRHTTIYYRRQNTRHLDQVEEAVKSINISKIYRVVFRSIMRYFMIITGLAFISILAGILLITISADRVDANIVEGLEFVSAAIWGTGIFLTANLYFGFIKTRWKI